MLRRAANIRQRILEDVVAARPVDQLKLGAGQIDRRRHQRQAAGSCVGITASAILASPISTS